MCSCEFNQRVCDSHRRDILRQLDRVDAIRAARGVDTVEADQIMAWLRIDYGADLTGRIAAETKEATL